MGTMYRAGENTPSERFDGERYFQLQEGWYFTTREGITMGPFQSRAEAISETTSYIDFISEIKGPVASILKRHNLTHPQKS